MLTLTYSSFAERAFHQGMDGIAVMTGILVCIIAYSMAGIFQTWTAIEGFSKRGAFLKYQKN
ncbi:hypothetical protein J7K93_06920 [bacterium]|nr:hypothetical protein [bacterium]